MKLRSPLVGFVLGLLLGLAVATGGSVVRPPSMAHGAILTGDGYLRGWTVTIDGEDLCAELYVWQATQEIECE